MRTTVRVRLYWREAFVDGLIPSLRAGLCVVNQEAHCRDKKLYLAHLASLQSATTIGEPYETGHSRGGVIWS